MIQWFLGHWIIKQMKKVKKLTVMFMLYTCLILIFYTYYPVFNVDIILTSQIFNISSYV